MEIIRVYIIFDDNFTKEGISQDLLEEGFEEEFIFGCDIGNEFKETAIKGVNEVWLFGDGCEFMMDYIIAKNNGANCWIMA